MNTKLTVQYDQNLVYNKSPKERYGDWSERYESSITDVIKDKQVSGEEFNIDQDVNLGDIVYVLYMIYSTGDSFGRSTGNIEPLWVFKDAKVAVATMRELEKNQKADSLVFKTESGREIKLSNPGAGYFECVDKIDIQICMVK